MRARPSTPHDSRSFRLTLLGVVSGVAAARAPSPPHRKPTVEGNLRGAPVWGGGGARPPYHPFQDSSTSPHCRQRGVGEKCCKNPGSWNPWESFGSEAKVRTNLRALRCYQMMVPRLKVPTVGGWGARAPPLPASCPPTVHHQQPCNDLATGC